MEIVNNQDLHKNMSDACTRMVEVFTELKPKIDIAIKDNRDLSAKEIIEIGQYLLYVEEGLFLYKRTLKELIKTQLINTMLTKMDLPEN